MKIFILLLTLLLLAGCAGFSQIHQDRLGYEDQTRWPIQSGASSV